MKKTSMSKMTKAPKKIMKGGTSSKTYAKVGTVTTGDPGERFKKKADKEAAKSEFKKQRLQNKLDRKQTRTEARQDRKSTEAQGDAAVDRALTQKKTNRAGRIGDLIKRARSSERKVKVSGDRRIFGNNSNTTNTDNSTTTKSTTTTSGAAGGGGGQSGSRSDSGSSSRSGQSSQQGTSIKDERNSRNRSNKQTQVGSMGEQIDSQQKGGTTKNKKIMKKSGMASAKMAKPKMKTGGMSNPNKIATVTKKATKYTGGKNGSMMMYGDMSKKKK
jgi:hypothetical protein